jgi:hypothetical protein
MEKALDFLASPAVMSVIAIIIGALWGYFKRKVLKEEGWIKEVSMLAETAVTTVYLDFVRELKIKSEDGKLTIEEKREALDKALKKIKELAQERGIALAKKYSDDILKMILERAISKLKS